MTTSPAPLPPIFSIIGKHEIYNPKGFYIAICTICGKFFVWSNGKWV